MVWRLGGSRAPCVGGGFPDWSGLGSVAKPIEKNRQSAGQKCGDLRVGAGLPKSMTKGLGPRAGFLPVVWVPSQVQRVTAGDFALE